MKSEKGDTMVIIPNHEMPKLSYSPDKGSILSSSPSKDNHLLHFNPESTHNHISKLADDIQEDEDAIQRFNTVIANIDGCSDPKRRKLLEKNRPEYMAKIKKVQKRLKHKYAEMNHLKDLVDEYNNEQEAIEMQVQADKEEMKREKEKEIQDTMDALDRAYRLENRGLALRVENPNDPNRLEKLGYVHPDEKVEEENESDEIKVEGSPVLSHKEKRKQKKTMRKERAMSNP